MTQVGVQDFQHGFDVGFNDSEIFVEALEDAFPYPISIDGRGYVMDLAKYQRRTLSQYRQQSDTSQEPGEQSLSVEGVWKRTGVSSVMGAGQEFYDDTDSDRRRFWQSRGINPWVRREVRLLPATQLVRAGVAGTQSLIVVDGHLYLIDGATVYESTEPLNPAVAWGDVGLGAGATISSVTTNGTRLFAACGGGGGGGIRSMVPGAAGVSMVPGGTLAADFVHYGNGWLVAAAGPRLVSVAAAGTVTDIWTHQNPGFSWECGASAPNAIYLAGNAGDKAEIYRTGIDDTGSALTTPIFAGDFGSPGEIVYALKQSGGVMLIGTSRGLRVANIQTDGSLAIGAVIEDGSGQGVRCFEVRGRFAWFGYVNPLGLRRGLGRANLSRNTEDSVPAFAADLECDEGTGHTHSVVTWVEGNQEYRLFTVSGSGLWAQTGDLVEEGTLDLGYLGQGSPEPKTLQSVSVSHQALQGSIEIVLENDRGQQVSAESVVQATYQSGELVRSLTGELIKVRLVLRSLPDRSAGPVIRRWTIRVVPAPAGVDEIIVPLLIADRVDDDDLTRRVHQDTFAEFRALKFLENERSVVNYREGQATYRVTVREVGMDGANAWSRKRRFFNATILVRMVTVEGVPPQLGGI